MRRHEGWLHTEACVSRMLESPPQLCPAAATVFRAPDLLGRTAASLVVYSSSHVCAALKNNVPLAFLCVVPNRNMELFVL